MNQFRFLVFRRIGTGSSSIRSLLSRRGSLTRGRSPSGISPILSPADGGVVSEPIEDPIEKVKVALEMLGTVINRQSEPDSSNESKRLQLLDVHTYCQGNLPQLSQILEKCGGAANGQIPAITSRTQTEVYRLRELPTILRGLSHLHWVGAFLYLLGAVLDRCSKAFKRSAELLVHMKNLRELGQYVLAVYGLEPVSRNSEPSGTLQEAVRIISEHADYCCQELQTKFFSRFLCADTNHNKLVDFDKDIDKLYRKLQLTILLQNRQNGPAGETFQLSEDTVMVGGEKRVGEAMQKLESNDNEAGVRALILWGMLGTGKSMVGLKVASLLKEQRNIDTRQCCKILMRGDTEIKVTKKQDELYWKLHRRGVKKDFSDFRQGQRELLNLFRDELGDEPLLLLFDDADRPEDLEKLLPDDLETALPPGSILLVTTTNSEVRNVLEKKGVDCRAYEVNVLEKKEAQALLLKKILGSGDQDVLPDLAVAKHLMQSEPFPKLVDVCGGMPLAINVVGSSVRKRGQEFLREWFPDQPLRNLSLETVYLRLDADRQDEFLEKLTKATNHAYEVLSVGDPINISRSPLRRGLDFAFEQLNSNPPLRDVFLDIVAVHLGGKWSDVELEFGTEYLGELKQLSMVQCLTYKDGTSGVHEPLVQVHDLLIGMSRKLENTENCRGRRVVVKNVDTLPECFWDDQGCAVYNRVELLKVDHCKEVITAEQLDRVRTNLRYLELHGTTIAGKCARVPPRLKYFKSRQSSLPFALHDLKSLVVLDLEGTSDNEVIQWMPNLQKLKVENSWSLKRLGPRLKKLTTVVIVNCPNFESIEGLDSAAVEHLETVNCPNFQDFSSVSKLKRLKRLCLAGYCQASRAFTKFPEELVIPSGVQILDLSRNSNLLELPTFAPNSRIKKLNLRFCCALKQFGGEGVCLTTLEYLNLGGCEVLERVPSLSKHHPKLKVLDVQGCEKLKRSELRLSLVSMRARNPEFRLIGLRLTDEADGLRVWPTLKRCIQFSFKKTRSLFQKVKSGVPRRNLNTSWTFPIDRPKYL